MVRVLIVDDDKPLLRSWRRSLSKQETEVAVADGFDEAVRVLCTASELDAALIDLVLGESSGLELVPTVRRLQPQAGVAIVSAHLDAGAAIAAQAHGALCVPKPLSADRLQSLVQLLAGRQSPFGVDQLFPGLTRRECQVVEQAVRGCDTAAAARTLHISEHTVQLYWHRVFCKTGLGGKAEVLAAISRWLARRCG